MKMQKPLSGKTAIITGAAQGIGAACVRLLSKNGANVVISDKNLSKCEVLEKKLTDKGFSTLAIELDITDESSVQAMVTEVIEKFGQIDILVNNAGILNTIQLPETPTNTWRNVIDVNLTGTFLCCKSVLEVMASNNYGKIVNIASIAGENGGPIVGPDYAASKAGVISLTKSVARYGAKHGITANAICPGYIISDMTKTLSTDPNTVPLCRLGIPEDVAKVVFFFVSELSDYVTGTTLEVDGGLLMR